VGAAVHAGAGSSRAHRDRATRRITELGSARVVRGQAWPAGDLGVARRASRSAGAASGSRGTSVGCRRTRRTGWCTARSELGRRSARAAGGRAAARAGCALCTAARSDMGRRPAGRGPGAATASTTTAAACASRCRAAAGCRPTRADVGIR
jgi:hypothetical protein